MTIKNQLSELKKGFKTTKDMLYVMDSELLYKDKIHEDIKLMSICKKIELFCLWFYYMKNMIEDRFDNIGIAITNSGGKIEINFMGK